MQVGLRGLPSLLQTDLTICHDPAAVCVPKDCTVTLHKMTVCNLSKAHTQSKGAKGTASI